MDFRHVTTERLRLDAVVPGDLDEHFALMSDPGGWRHLPSGLHTPRSRPWRASSTRSATGRRDGLGYWTARLREDLPEAGLTAGAMVGTGGCAVRDGDSWWNLYYRLTPRAWGLGLAAELVTAAIDAAHAVDPDRPVIAYLLEHNAESRGRAERSGLQLLWRGPDAGNPDPAAVRLVYADRPLYAELLDRSPRAPDQAPGTAKYSRVSRRPAPKLGEGRLRPRKTATAPGGKPACSRRRARVLAGAVVEVEGELPHRRVVADDGHRAARPRSVSADHREHGLDGVVVDPLVDRRLRVSPERPAAAAPGLPRTERG